MARADRYLRPTLCGAFAAIVLCAFCNVASARRLARGEAFSPSYLADATDIVVVTEGGKIDGEVKVLDVWKGDLEKGEWITVPELAGFAGKKSRAVSGRPQGKVPLSVRPRMAAFRIKGYLYGRSPLFVADHVTCKRLVLFLKRVSEAVEKLPEGDGGDSVHYVPAGLEGNIKTSVAWIEHGWAYFYTCFVSPGEVTLMGPEKSEKDLKAEVMAEVARLAYEEA